MLERKKLKAWVVSALNNINAVKIGHEGNPPKSIADFGNNRTY
jgi:hypothetical protein